MSTNITPLEENVSQRVAKWSHRVLFLLLLVCELCLGVVWRSLSVKDCNVFCWYSEKNREMPGTAKCFLILSVRYSLE